MRLTASVQNSKGVAVDVSMIPEEAQGRTRWPEPWSGYDRSDVEALQGLVADGVEKGFLTYDEIAVGLEDVVLKPEQIEDFYTYLLDRSVELVEGEQHKQPPHGGRPRTLDEVGRTFGVTRERIRQIEYNTLKTLASLPEAQRLNDCV